MLSLTGVGAACLILPPYLPGMLIALPVLVLLIGAVLYVVSSSAKPQELGRLMFACGLLVALLAVGHGGALKLW